MLTVAFNFAKLPFEFGSLHSKCWVLSLVAFCMRSSAELFWKAWLLEAALIKPVLKGDHSERGLTLELWVQTLLGAALCERINCCCFAMCNHHCCQGLQN